MNESVKKIARNAKQAILVTLVLMLICGLLFPLLMTGLSSLLFPHQAGGSLLESNGTLVGAKHVGQEFVDDGLLWSRPSAYHYNVYTEGKDGELYYRDETPFGGLASGSNNYAPTNPDLIARVEADITSFLEKNPTVAREDIPTDLVTASGSGLDPHISPAAADIQVPRIAAASGLSEDAVREIIKAHTEGKLLGIFGENMVNVLEVNIDLTQAK